MRRDSAGAPVLDPPEREAVETIWAGARHMHDAERWHQSANASGVARAAATFKAAASRTKASP